MQLKKRSMNQSLQWKCTNLQGALLVEELKRKKGRVTGTGRLETVW